MSSITFFQDIPEVPPAKKKKIVSSFQKKQEQLLDSTNKILNAKEDDWEIIGRSFGVQLRDLTANQKLIARKLISDVIFYGSTEQLTNNSYISIPSLSVIPSPSPSPNSVPFPLSSPQYEYNETPQSPFAPTSQNISQSNHPKIIIKRNPKPSSTNSFSSPKSIPFSLISSQSEYKENQYISQSPLSQTPQNHPQIIIKKSSANKQQTNSKQTTISQDDSQHYGDHEESSVIYEGKGSELGSFLLFNKKHDN